MKVLENGNPTNTGILKKISIRQASNLYKREFGTEKRGRDIAFTSADTLKDEGIEPATFTAAGESMYQTIISYSDEIGLDSREVLAVKAFLLDTSNGAFAGQLGLSASSASNITKSMVKKLRKAADTNPELLAVLIESAQNPQHFIAAVKIASAADPNIREDRVAGLVEAQRKYQESKQTRADWDELNAAIAEYKAIVKSYPQPTIESLLSREQILSALKSDGAKRAQAYFDRQDSGQTIVGEVIDVRIDIPAYNKTLKEQGEGQYVVTFHGTADGKTAVIGHDSFVHLTGFGESGKVEFVEGKDPKKINIATGVKGGRGNKSSFARARGAVASTTVIPDVTGAEWTQVGFDPERHSYFYNRANPAMRVTSGTEALSIGNTVFVRNAEMDDAFDAGVAFAAAPHLAEDAGFASKVLDGIADIKKRVFRFFDSSGGLKMPSAMNADKQLNLFQPKIDKDAYINSVMGVVRAENRNLKLAIKKELGKATEKDVATINSALNGDAASLAELTPDVRNAVERMRNQIDGLSRHLISKGWITRRSEGKG